MAGRPREFDRDDVLDRAVTLFWSKGYEATGIAELTDELQIGRQSLYCAFGNKQELFVAALHRYLETQLAGILSVLTAPGPPLGNVRKVLATWQSAACSGEGHGCLLANSAAELGARDAVVAPVLDQMLQRLEDGFAAALARARSEGTLSSDKDPRALARLIVTTGQGLAILSKVRTGRAYAKDTIRSLDALLK